MMRRILRCIGRWHLRALIKDVEFELRVHQAHLRGLPAEIRRLTELRRFHQGRLATLSEPRDPVNFRLGRSRRPSVS